MERALQMSKGCEDTCVPCKSSSKGDFSEDDFNNQVDGMTHSVDCQPLSPTILSLPHGSVNKVATVTVMQDAWSQ